jgi:hypothetical protein
MAKIPPLEDVQPPPIESYPVLMTRMGVDMSQLPAARLMGPAVGQIKDKLDEQERLAKAAAS